MQRPRRATKVPVHLRILTVLHFLDQGGYKIGTGHGYLIAQSQPAVSRCIAEVTNLMTAHLLNVGIKFPNSDEERQRIKRGFQELVPTFASGISGAPVITIFDNNAISLSSNSDNGFRVFGPPPVPTVSS
jgi:hypothetical protein